MHTILSQDLYYLIITIIYIQLLICKSWQNKFKSIYQNRRIDYLTSSIKITLNQFIALKNKLIGANFKYIYRYWVQFRLFQNAF